MASVFLSYARDDRDKAEAVAAALEGLGHSVWWDRRLEGGSRFSQEIEQALKDCDVVLVLWSAVSVRSAWVQDEAAEGRDSGRLVPVVIDSTKPPLGFRQFQAIDLSGWKGRGSASAIDALHRAILARAGAAGSIETPPAPTVKQRFHGRFGIGAAAAAGLLAVAASVYWFAGPSASTGEDALRLRLGEFSATADVPASVTGSLRDELLTALATDSVVVAAAERPGSSGAGAEPGFALSANIRKTQDLLNLTVHLVNERTGTTIWSDSLERPAAIADKVPRQLAVAVSQVLRCGLGGAARHPKALPDEALSIYLSFCEEFWADTAGKPVNPSRAVDLAHRLTEAAPDFSRGWSAMAEVATWSEPGNRPLNEAALRAKAVQAAERALHLDDENSEAYSALAQLQPPTAHAERERMHLKAISVRPGDCGCDYVGYGGFLNRVGRNVDAADAYRRAHDMIPLSAEVNVRWAEGLFLAGRPDEARRIISQVREIWPDYPFVRQVLLRNAFSTGQYDEALALIDDPVTPLSGAARDAFRSAVRSLNGGGADSRSAAVRSLVALGPGAGGDVRLAISALGALGANREALSLAASSFADDNSRSQLVLYEPPLASARQTPQFAALARRLGLIDYWRKSGRKPDFCNAPSAPSLCASL